MASELAPVAAPVQWGDQVRGQSIPTMRIIGVELRFRDHHHGLQEELELLPAHCIVPNPRNFPGGGRYSMPITVHTTIGDFNGEIYL